MAKHMEIELNDGLESITFEVKDENAVAFIKNRLDAGRDFEIFFPDYEVG